MGEGIIEMKKIKESFVMIAQSFAILFVFVLPFKVNVQEIFKQYLTNNYPTPENYWVYLPLSYGNIAISILISGLLYWKIRKNNSNMFMNRDTNVYHDYPYVWYLYCAKVLGIKKCNLINVPIYMQIKLSIHQIFDEYPLNDSEYPIDENEVVSVLKENEDASKQVCNLILEDTYPIEEIQIPRNVRKHYTVKVSRHSSGDFGRHYSEKFITQTINEVRSLPNDITLNVFATTNPKNSLNIAKQVFAQAERGNVSHIYVFQQRKTGRRIFEEKGKRIY